MKAAPEVSEPAPTRSPVRIFLKWAVLVPLSAICSFIAALVSEHSTTEDIVAMLLGIVTFICAYSFLEIWLMSRGHTAFLKSLKTGVIIKMILQIIPGVEIGAGWVAHTFLILLPVVERGFLRTYLMTDIVGLLLSLVVLLLTAVVVYVRHLIRPRTDRGRK